MLDRSEILVQMQRSRLELHTVRILDVNRQRSSGIRRVERTISFYKVFAALARPRLLLDPTNTAREVRMTRGVHVHNVLTYQFLKQDRLEFVRKTVDVYAI